MISKQENIEFYLTHPSICEYCKCKILNYMKRNNRFCSRSCSNSFTNSQSTKSIETRDKISKTISSKFEKKIKLPKVFPNTRLCKNYFRDLLKLKGQYIEKRGGLRERGGQVKKYFNIIDSYGKEAFLNKDELSLTKYLIDNNIKWVRNLNGFDYLDQQGIKRRFYPDFYLPEYKLFVEYKGFVTDKMIHKMNDCKQRNNLNLLIIYSSKFKHLGLQIHEICNYLKYASVV